jgi:hypothetical protein
VSWPILLTVITISFGLGAFWQSKRAEDQRIEVPYPLPVMPYDNRGEYRMGRQQAERIAR